MKSTEKQRLARRAPLLTVAVLIAASPAQSVGNPIVDPYAPLHFMLGHWSKQDSPVVYRIIQDEAGLPYIWRVWQCRPSPRLLQVSLITWNAKSKRFEFLSGQSAGIVVETGHVEILEDGTVLRHVVLHRSEDSADSAPTYVREAFTLIGNGRINASVLAQDNSGDWLPAYEGADRIELHKLPESNASRLIPCTPNPPRSGQS